MISTDGWGPYAGSIFAAFGSRVQHGQIVKRYENPEQPGRYGPPDVIKIERTQDNRDTRPDGDMHVSRRKE